MISCSTVLNLYFFYSVIMSLLLLLVVMVNYSLAYEEVHSGKYLNLSAYEKSEIIFNNCLENTSPADWFSTWKMLGRFTESMCPTLTANGDEMPGNRHKYIHTMGGSSTSATPGCLAEVIMV